LGKQRVDLYSNEMLTGLINSFRSFLDCVVGSEDSAECGYERWCRCWYEQRSQGTVIKAQPSSEGKRLAPACAPGSRE
jgi:hypothetical protein